MSGLFKFAEGWFSRVALRDKPRSLPEPAFAASGEMKGFFARLTPDQQKAALSYEGEESFGDRPYDERARG
jgi:hypothetical protein